MAVYLSACLPVWLFGCLAVILDVHLTGMHLTGVHLTGVHLTGVHLTGVYFTGIYLIVYRCASQICISQAYILQTNYDSTALMVCGNGTKVRFGVCGEILEF